MRAFSLKKERTCLVSLSSDNEETVEEASEESFPSSDPPAWSGRDEGSAIAKGLENDNGYYFVADADHTICGLHVGMLVRTR